MGKSWIPDLSSVASPPRRDLEYNFLEIGEPIGSGGQAVVFRAQLSDANPPITVAVKEPLQDNRTLDRSTIEQFLAEANKWETIDSRERHKPRWRTSEHIVGVIDTGEELPWIALEYMDGGGLDDRLAANPEGLPLDEALWIGECICSGVELAHNYGIAHLDLKPSNVLFRETADEAWDLPKVADWGLARLLADQTGTMDALSVEYAAPEQFDSDNFGDPDMLTDVYQIGALVYAMLTGEPPFTGSQASVLHDIVYGDSLEPPSNNRPVVSTALDATVMTALERKKADRYPTVNTLGEALRAIRTDGYLPRIVAKQVPTDEQLVDGQDNLRASESVQTSNASSTATPSWPMFGCNLARTSVCSSVNTPIGAATEKWVFETGGAVFSSPVVADGTVFVGSDDSNLYAVDAETGTKQWSFETNDYVRSTPAVTNGTVFFGSDDGYLYALEASGGTEEWTLETSGWIRSSPVVSNGLVFVGSEHDRDLHAIDAATGTKQWTFGTDSRIYSSPALSDGTVFIGSVDGDLYAVDATTGTKQWEFETGSSVRSSPAVANGTVFVGSRDCNLYAVDAGTGNEEWSFEVDNWVWSSPAVSDGTVYVGERGPNLYAVDAGTGNEEWSFKVDNRVDSSPAVADGTVLAGCDNNLYAVDATTGTENWAFETGDFVRSSPAVADGTVFVGSDDDHLYAVDVTTGNGK